MSQLIVEEVRQAFLRAQRRGESGEHRATLESIVEHLLSVEDDELLLYIEETLRDLKQSRRCLGCGIVFWRPHSLARLCWQCWRGHVVAAHVRELSRLLQEAQ